MKDSNFGNRNYSRFLSLGNRRDNYPHFADLEHYNSHWREGEDILLELDNDRQAVADVG